MAAIPITRSQIQVYLPAVFVALVFAIIIIYFWGKRDTMFPRSVPQPATFSESTALNIDFQKLEKLSGYSKTSDPIIAPQEKGRENPFTPYKIRSKILKSISELLSEE